MPNPSKDAEKPAKPATPKAAKPKATSTKETKTVTKVAKPKAAVAKAPAAKSVAKPAAAKPVAAKKPAASTGKPKKAAVPALSSEQRRYYIEVAAYYIAERRGFHGAGALNDWVQAEAEIDQLLREGILKP